MLSLREFSRHYVPAMFTSAITNKAESNLRVSFCVFHVTDTTLLLLV